MRAIPFIVMLMLAAAADPAASAGLETILGQLGIDADADSLERAPIPGFLEVTRGMQVLYVAVDGGLVIKGDILSVPSGTNLTEERRAEKRREMLQAIPDDQTLIVPAQAPTVARVVIFTDVNCPYCLALHRGHHALLQNGIEIQYLFYPRSGPASDSFDQAVAVWCSKDRLAALGNALRGARLPETVCAHPVERHYELARELELKGTPAVIAADGSLQYGLQSLEDIVALARK